MRIHEALKKNHHSDRHHQSSGARCIANIRTDTVRSQRKLAKMYQLCVIAVISSALLTAVGVQSAVTNHNNKELANTAPQLSEKRKTIFAIEFSDDDVSVYDFGDC